MQAKVQRIVAHHFFEYAIVAVILVSAVLIGLETSEPVMAKYRPLIVLGNHCVLAIFIIEAAMKIYAVAPSYGRYFGSNWNRFDFSIIVLSLLPATGQLAMLARLARLLRVLRLISVIPELRLIVSTLIRSIPSMGNIMLLMGVIFYIYGVAGQQFFHRHDPEHWGNIGISLLTLFRIVTLEDWTDLMYKAMELSPYAWIYFVSFVVLGTFVIVNLFIAVVINNLEQAKAERLSELRLPPSRDDLMQELERTQASLARLQQRLEESERLGDRL